MCKHEEKNNWCAAEIAAAPEERLPELKARMERETETETEKQIRVLRFVLDCTVGCTVFILFLFYIYTFYLVDIENTIHETIKN